MSAPEAAQQGAYARPRLAVAGTRTFVPARTSMLRDLSWAVLASTLHRVRRGEGALLAVNLSLILWQGAGAARSGAQALVSMLAIGVMYAFNDLHDAPTDWNNPKKDQRLIAAWMAHRRAGVLATIALKLVTLAIALVTLGPPATAAVAGVMIINVAYSVVLKGVPAVDVAAVWLWGALYAAIVGPSGIFAVVVGLMTAICHLFQALDDRVPDAANGIETTAVRSAALARNVLLICSVLLFLVLRTPLGTIAALTAFTPLAIFFVVGSPRTGWLLTKAYFAVIWLALLGSAGAAG
jgi:4-hydroxybenzoate polyprenyltransferase